MKQTKKRLDCVEVMHRGGEHIRREIDGMTPEEELAHWRRGTEKLRKKQREARERRRRESAGG